MTDSALLKIDRASKHIDELEQFLEERRPFTYMIETNTETGRRATFAKRDPTVAAEAANIMADIVHNLRTALEHAYWDIVSPFATNEKERKAIQFPFGENATKLANSVTNRMADRVSAKFVQAIIDLKPHGDLGGNKDLYLINQLDNLDKHRFPIPTGDYKRITSDMIRRHAPDFPRHVQMSGTFAMNHRDVAWYTPPMPLEERKKKGLHPNPIFEQELNVPVEIVIAIGDSRQLRPVIPMLRTLTSAANNAIQKIRQAVT